MRSACVRKTRPDAMKPALKFNQYQEAHTSPRIRPTAPAAAALKTVARILIAVPNA
jgi:hypothetical protein